MSRKEGWRVFWSQWRELSRWARWLLVAEVGVFVLIGFIIAVLIY